ncbi:MAG: hypothetical protein HY830_05010 [Actinobacteria bacterium]|nr:hypothetical protein [Actinomycetota bacterium]
MARLVARPAEEAVTVAVARTALLARAALAAPAAVVAAVADQRWVPAAALVAVVALATVAELAALSRTVGGLRRPEVLCAALAADVLVVLLVLVLGGPGVAYFVVAAAWSFLAGVLLAPRAAVLPVLAMVVQCGVAAASALGRPGTVPGLTAVLLAAPVAVLLAGLGGATAVRLLQDQALSAAMLVGVVQRETAAAERARLARELHDSVGKTLRAISLAAGALPGSVHGRPGAAEQLAAVIQSSADTATTEARELIAGLRLDQPDRRFVDVLDAVCRDWAQGNGIPVRVRASDVEPPLHVRYELVRVLGEALTNVARHAWATTVDVRFQVLRTSARLSVADDGYGFAVPADLAVLLGRGHAGLVGMRERAESVGGRLDVVSAPGSGTTVAVTVPW